MAYMRNDFLKKSSLLNWEIIKNFDFFDHFDYPVTITIASPSRPYGTSLPQRDSPS